jgi:glucose-6-phosphate 1-dehydrogenase
MTETIGFCQETRPDNCGFVLLGATGDLSGRKIIPALFGLCEKKLAPKNFYIVLSARTELDRPDVERRIWDVLSAAGFSPSPGSFSAFLTRLEYLRADYSPEFFVRLRERLAGLDARHGVENRRLFYLATPPEAFEPIVAGLKAGGLVTDPADCSCWSRIIIEKPYGSSLENALSLDEGLKGSPAEKQVYRIDHFTGKETVQNVLALRSANHVFDATWNSEFVDHVQITAFEELGVEERASFFERIGLARDMMSHILQLAAIIAMDLPASLRDTDFKEEKRRFFSAVLPPERLLRGQYSGYRSEPGVAPSSVAETFFAVKFAVDNDRWRGVPFYARAGKKTGAKMTRVDVVYKKPQRGMFKNMDIGLPNVFSFGIQPEESVSFSLICKHPGPRLCFTPRSMGLDYRPDPEDALRHPTDYERLLIEAMSGDQTLFLSSFETKFLWQFLAPVLESWSAPAGACPLYTYPDGTPGPAEAAGLMEKDGRQWL